MEFRYYSWWWNRRNDRAESERFRPKQYARVRNEARIKGQARVDLGLLGGGYGGGISSENDFCNHYKNKAFVEGSISGKSIEPGYPNFGKIGGEAGFQETGNWAQNTGDMGLYAKSTGFAYSLGGMAFGGVTVEVHGEKESHNRILRGWCHSVYYRCRCSAEDQRRRRDICKSCKAIQQDGFLRARVGEPLSDVQRDDGPWEVFLGDGGRRHGYYSVEVEDRNPMGRSRYIGMSRPRRS